MSRELVALLETERITRARRPRSTPEQIDAAIARAHAAAEAPTAEDAPEPKAKKRR